jgi:hypothetical protein
MTQKENQKLKRYETSLNSFSARISTPIYREVEPLFTKEENKSEISKETLRNIYGNDFEGLSIQLKLEEENTKNYFHEIMTGLDERYQQFNTNMYTHFSELTNKIAEAFKLNNNNRVDDDKENKELDDQNAKSALVQKYSRDYIERMKKIISMHKQIFESIKDTISILFNFLDISKSLEKEKPIQEFLGKEFKNIINSWLFLKLDIEKFDFAQALNNSQLDNNFKNFIFKVCQGKNFVMNITFPKQYILEENLNNLSPKIKAKLNAEKNKNKTILKENRNNLVKLKMTNIFDADTYLEDIFSFDNMKSLKMKKVSFKNKNDLFLKNCQKLEKLYIHSSKNFDINLLKNVSKRLIKLSLSNNDLVDNDFNKIVKNYLIKSNSIRNNLKYLSFANNNLCYIDFGQIVTSQKNSFLALKQLNFSKNQIYKFSIPLEYFSELKCIICCYNNFARDYFASYPDLLVLQGGNTFLLNTNLSKKYYNELGKKLNSFQINLSYLNLSYMHSKLSNEYLSNLKINDTILLGLKKLDLSYNNITNIVFFNFIDNNKGILNLKSLNLNGNKLDDLFFEIYLNLKLNNKFTKLTHLHLESNLFGDETIEVTYNPEEGKFINNKVSKIRLLYRFISENKGLTELSLIKNNIFGTFKLLNMKNSENEAKLDDEGNIVIIGLNSFLRKIKKELLVKNEEQNNRRSFNLKFDCQSDINQNSENIIYEYE